MAERLSIGELAAATKTKVETIRYYESIGLLKKPPRSKNNYRSYEGQHLARLGFVKRARGLGFSIEAVRELLGMSDDKRRSCAQVDEIARQHLADVDAKIRALKKLRRELDSVIRQCHSGTVADCRIIETLAS